MLLRTETAKLQIALFLSVLLHAAAFVLLSQKGREAGPGEYKIVQLMDVQTGGGPKAKEAAPAARKRAPAAKEKEIPLKAREHDAEQKPESAPPADAQESSSGPEGGGAGEGDGEGYLPVFKVMRLPQPRERIRPVYPAKAQLSGAQAKVLLEVYIDTEGRPRKVVVVKSGGPEFDASAEEAVRRARFLPALSKEGKPVPVRVRLPFSFELE